MTIKFLVIAMHILYYMPTRQHFIPHRQMCFESIYCNHTWVATCGKEKNDNSIRTFLDTCDMFEYNCDNRKEYFEIDLDNCQANENENTVDNVTPKDNPTTDTTAEVPATLNSTETLAEIETTKDVKSTADISKTTLEMSAQTITSSLVEYTPPELLNNNTILSTSTSKLVPNSTITLKNEIATKITSTQTDEMRISTTCTRNTETTTVELPNQLNESTVSSIERTISSVPITTQSTKTTESTTSQFTMTKDITTKTTTTEVTTVLSTAIQCAKTQCCCCCSSLAQVTEKLPKQIQSTTTQPVVTTKATIQSQSTLPTTTTVSSTTESIQPKTMISTTTLPTTTQLTTESLPRNVTTEVSPEKNNVIEETKDDPNHTERYNSSTSLSTKCNKTLPGHCDVPVTWETTLKGETRDFYQILRARFGDKLAILRDTTHWPKQNLAADSRRNRFLFGRHNDT